jgi:catechol 2,3-dioxygenase-like lactoylglutathione lyase family enzyme
MGASGSKSRDLEARVARLEAENEQLRFTVKHGGQGYDYAPRPGATTLDGLLGRVNHIARIVADAEASRKFYVDVLGAKLLNRPYIPGAGFWLWLGNIQLHLIEAPHAAVAAEAQHADNVATGVANHLSFDTHDFDACVAALRAGQHPFQRIVLPANEVEVRAPRQPIYTHATPVLLPACDAAVCPTA